MFLGPIVALVLLWDDRGSSAFVLTAIGLGIVFLGVIMTTWSAFVLFIAALIAL